VEFTSHDRFTANNGTAIGGPTIAEHEDGIGGGGEQDGGGGGGGGGRAG
jgi:hypothetical protein